MDERTGGITKALNDCRVQLKWMQNLVADDVTLERPEGLTKNFDTSLKQILHLVSRGYG